MPVHDDVRADARFAAVLGDDARIGAIMERAVSMVEDWLERGGWEALEASAQSASARSRPRWSDPEVRERVRDQFSEVVKAVVRAARKEAPKGFIGTTTVALAVIEDLTRDIGGGLSREPSNPQELMMLLAEHAWRRAAPTTPGAATIAITDPTEGLADRAVAMMVDLADGTASGLDDDEEDVLIFSILDHKYDDSLARICRRLNATGEAVRQTIRTLGTRVTALGG